MVPLPGIVGPSNQAAVTAVDCERTVNLYPVTKDKGTPKAETWFYATPGLSLRQTIGIGPHRGAFYQDGREWVISGTDFREVFADKSSISRGSVVGGSDQSTIVSNGQAGGQLFVVVGGYGYVFNLTTNVLTLIADADFPQGQAIMCGFLDGYGIVLTSADFQISSLEDFTTWDALDVAQKSQTSDNLVSMVVDVDHKVVWFFGSQNIEIWWDAGTASFPFEPVPNSMISIGACSQSGVLITQIGLVWVGENVDGGRCLYAGAGGQAKKISSDAVDLAWSTYATVRDMVAFQFIWRGHEMCVFTCAGGTWVFDAVESEWHEWLMWDTASGSYQPHLAITHVYAFDEHQVGSRVDGSLYTLSATTQADGSLPLRRLRRGAHVFKGGDWLTCNTLRFDFQVGVGLTSGQGVNPQVMLKITRDGGRTYGNERWTSLGAIGAGTARVEYRRNGRWRDGGVELVITDPVVVALTGAWGAFDVEAA